MSVVSNASPLIGLARIGELELLRQLYGELVIPEAVEHEVVVEGADLPAADQVEKAAWIKPQVVSNEVYSKVVDWGLSAQRAYPSFNSAQPIKSPLCEGKGYARHGRIYGRCGRYIQKLWIRD